MSSRQYARAEASSAPTWMFLAVAPLGEEPYFNRSSGRWSVFGNLVADATRDSGKADLAFVSGDIITGAFIPLPNREDVEKQVRAGETLYRVQMVGSEIVDIISRNLENYRNRDTILYFSGMTVEVGGGKDGAPKITIGIEPLMPHRVYKVIIHKALLDAPAGFRQFKSRLLDAPALSMLPTVSDATLEFLKSSPVIKVQGDRLQDPHGMLR